MNSGLTSHQQRGHTETGPRFKVSSERPEKRGIDLATPGLVVQRVIHYTTAAPVNIVNKISEKKTRLSLGPDILYTITEYYLYELIHFRAYF